MFRFRSRMILDTLDSLLSERRGDPQPTAWKLGLASLEYLRMELSEMEGDPVAGPFQQPPTWAGLPIRICEEDPHRCDLV